MSDIVAGSLQALEQRSTPIVSNTGPSPVPRIVSAPEALASLKQALLGIGVITKTRTASSWNKEKLRSLKKRYSSWEILFRIRRFGEEEQELKLRNTLQRKLEVTSSQLHKISTASRFERLTGGTNGIYDLFEDTGNALLDYQISLLHHLFAIGVKILEIAGLQVRGEHEQELKRREPLQARLEMFFSQLPKNATTARVKMLADKEYEEALNRCVKHIYDSLTIYQLSLHKHLLAICTDIMELEPEQTNGDGRQLLHMQRKFGATCAHLRTISDQSPMRLLIENSNDNGILLGYTSRIHSVLTAHQEYLQKISPLDNSNAAEDQYKVQADGGSPQKLKPSPPLWDAEFIREQLPLSEGRERLRTAEGKNALLVINVLDEILDTSNMDTTRSASCIGIMRSICGRCAILPTSHMISSGLEIMPGEEPVASGGFADVFQGTLRGVLVAVKVMKLKSSDQLNRMRKMFYKEAVIWRRLSHINVLPFLGAASPALYPLALVSAWMQKGDIVKYVKVHREVNRLGLLVDVAAGVNYLHSRRPSLAHGDLKGGNILINAEDRALLADFGLMTVVRDHETANTNVETSSTSARGTTRWMSPELVYPELFGLSSANSTKASDVYALGMVILEVLTCKVPFYQIHSRDAVNFKVLTGLRPPRPDNSLEIGLVDDVWNAVELCWNKDALQRPAAKEVLDVLEKASSSWNPGPAISFDSDVNSKLVDSSTQTSSIFPHSFDMSAVSSRALTSVAGSGEVTEGPLKAKWPTSPPAPNPKYAANKRSTSQITDTPTSSYHSLPSSRSPSPTVPTS